MGCNTVEKRMLWWIVPQKPYVRMPKHREIISATLFNTDALPGSYTEESYPEESKVYRSFVFILCNFITNKTIHDIRD
jgi:hypothetical protein